ncbi:hypothetical protein FFLO_01639 [Filobasidium floriforme]|uniref:glutamate--tRNA ligase n=1 Tax=Filobasidium floriforme TaxID=5210 RepID=A0A8K0JP85_9TREE|nr:putative Glutamyl-tRNA synthetase [Filobasidium floriforme]KAG7562949.1 hypothetical protein FFLO_01639 [Filobasidium floriforme]KAH8080598.1 putative Glutamyl-tRNA synthetase [Filobasidium floriforme]
MGSWSPIVVRSGTSSVRRSVALKRCYHPPTGDSGKTPVALQNAADEAFHPPEGQARLRFAPSPTGYLHLGGLRTALFNHLFARKWKGKWILRIEDTDRTRLVDDAISSMQRTLDWAGLDYDEGPGRGGDVGPYIQSERRDLYNQHLSTLLDNDKAYHCFCSPDELSEIRKAQQAKKATASYDGRCRHLTEEDVARRKRAGHKFVVRFKDPGDDADLPPDMIFGPYPSTSSPATSSSSSSSSKTWSRPQSPTSALLAPRNSSGLMTQAKGFRGPGSFSNRDKDLDDFILMKGDGYPTYHFANVIDDTTMGITHVFRGEEWLPSTPKHYQIYRALGWNAPHFAHLPLLVNPDGTKLSKRTGDVSVEAYEQKGYEPSALINFLSLIGWDHHHPTTSATQRPFFPIDPASLSSAASHDSSSSSSSLTSGLDMTSLDLRKDYNSFSELYTLDMLVESFSLERVGRTRGSVFLGKLDWLNKMHLKRVGMMHEGGEVKEGKGREGLVRRVKGMLKGKDVFQGCARIEDDEFVGKVLDIELPRATVLSDIPSLSVFFFLRPNLSNPETLGMWKEWSGSGEVRYTEIVGLVRKKLASSSSSTSSEKDVDTETEEWMDGVIESVTQETGMKRSGVVKVLRHALTGRKKGPAIPSVMAVLGREECIGRLEAVEAWLEVARSS